MRRIIYTLLLSLIMIAGLFIGMVRGQEVRNKWISKMKFKHEERKENKKQVPHGEIMLDEIEEATYHS
jgi:adenylylsulfate kinase-like enzyme